MSSKNDTAIQVDFEVNRRDVFRTNLDLAKWRLLLGLAVAAISDRGPQLRFHPH